MDMIHGVISNSYIPSYGYVMNASANGRIALPVDPASLIYSHFRHVSGVPAPEGRQGVAISKLNILDALIEQMNRMKNNGDLNGSTWISEDRMDTMIESFSIQIRQAMEAQAVMPYNPAPLAQTGALFNIMI